MRLESDAGEVDLWQATDNTAASAIEASGNLRCDDNGVAYVPNLAGNRWVYCGRRVRRSTRS
jgi:hypothetical protein